MMKLHYLGTMMIGLMLTQTAFAYQKNKTYHFTVLHTNDTHGHFWHNDKGEYGFPAQQTIIQKIKQEVNKKNGSLIILHAGDINTGVPESDLLNARPDIEALNHMGYEAMALGNHEFDNPLQLLDMQQKWAKFPFLSANIIHRKTGRLLVKPYTILNKNGLKFAIVGLTTEETAQAGNPQYIKNVQFIDANTAVRQILPHINQHEKPDVRIALSHLGYHNNQPQATSDQQLVQTLPAKTFDMVIGGHSHTKVCVDTQGKLLENHYAGEPCRPDYQRGTWIMQAGEWGKYLGRADFKFKNGVLTLLDYQLIPINLKQKVKNLQGKESFLPYQETIVPDAQLSQLLHTYQQQGAEKLSEPVANISGTFNGSREVVRNEQSALAKLILLAQKERVAADLAIMNGGAIRASLPEGNISYRDVLMVQPFGNVLSYVDLTGAELSDYLRKIAFHKPDTGAYTQFSADVSMTVNRTNQTVEHIKINDQPIVPTQTYRLALLNYVAQGGDNFPKLSNHPHYKESGLIDAEVLKTFLQQRKNIDAAEFANQHQVVYQ